MKTCRITIPIHPAGFCFVCVSNACPDGRQSGQFVSTVVPRAGPVWFCLSRVPKYWVLACLCAELDCPRAKMGSVHNRQTPTDTRKSGGGRKKKREKEIETGHRKETGPPFGFETCYHEYTLSETHTSKDTQEYSLREQPLLRRLQNRPELDLQLSPAGLFPRLASVGKLILLLCCCDYSGAEI